MDQKELESTNPKKWFKLSRWVWVITVIAVGAIAINLVAKLDSNLDSQTESRAKDTADEIKIKQYTSSLRGDIVRYFETNKTYVGWKVNQSAADAVKKLNSEIQTKALSADNYVVYAKMPSSKLIFCMDSKGYTGMIENMNFWQKSCK